MYLVYWLNSRSRGEEFLIIIAFSLYNHMSPNVAPDPFDPGAINFTIGREVTAYYNHAINLTV